MVSTLGPFLRVSLHPSQSRNTKSLLYRIVCTDGPDEVREDGQAVKSLWLAGVAAVKSLPLMSLDLVGLVFP